MGHVVGSICFVREVLYAGVVALLVTALAGIALLVALPEDAGLAVGSAGMQLAAADSGVPGDWYGELPRLRTVSVVDRIEGAWHARPQGGIFTGQYDTSSREIWILKDASKLTLAHEYGHALLHDLLLDRGTGHCEADPLFARIERLDRSSGPEGLPVWLQDAYRGFQASSPNVYGSRYFGDSFGEYIAESFAWYTLRAGTGVAPEMKALLAGVDGQSR